MPTVRLENVSKYYQWEGRSHAAVKDVSLEIQQGEFVFLVGSSGAGKSTLLSLITGELKPDSGDVFLDFRNISGISRRGRRQMPLAFGRVWQDEMLMRKRTIKENLTVVARIGRWSLRDPKSNIDARVAKVLGLVGMAGVEHKYPYELSQGEIRRVELARALINSPSILVLDEVTANLDDDNIWDMFHLLRELNHRGTTIIMATHAKYYVNIMRRRVVTMVDGKILGDVKKGRYGDLV